MITTSPPEKIDQLITVFSQRLQPPALQRLSVTDILQDASSMAIMKEPIPSVDSFPLAKQQKPCFGRLLKFLHLHEPTGHEKDEEHKRAAMRYLALRTMLQQCIDIKIQSIQEGCLNKVLSWFEETETSAFTSGTTSTPILPPRMSPKKQMPSYTIDKCPSEISFFSSKTSSNSSMETKLKGYKMPDLRASHIRRIVELRSRGVDIFDAVPSFEDDNNSVHRARQEVRDFSREEVEKRMVDATFKVYRPETEAEREMNLLWIRRRKEEEVDRKKDEEVQRQVKKWAMDRSRDESESLRKRESTKLVSGLQQLTQEGIDQDHPFARQSLRSIHPDLAAQMASRSNLAPRENQEAVQSNDVATYKQRVQKQPAQIVIKTRKSSSGGGGMHFRNQLPPNYVPPGLLAAASVPKDRRDPLPFTSKANSSSTKRVSASTNKLERTASAIADDASSESEGDDPEADEDTHRKKNPEVNAAQRDMKFQSFHVQSYYTDETQTHAQNFKSSRSTQKAHPRGTIPVQSLPADPELRCLQEASAMRRVFAIPSDKKQNGGARPNRSAQSARSARVPAGRVVLPRAATPEIGGATSTSDLRQSQLEEVEKIRRLFQENNLSFSPDVLERGLLVPEDRPLLESVYNLPLAGSRLLRNPLTRKSKTSKMKKKTSAKKKSKKTKKSSKGPKTPKSSRSKVKAKSK